MSKNNFNLSGLPSRLVLFLFITFISASFSLAQTGNELKLNDSLYFETRGFNVFFFNNFYGMFGDEKLSGVEIIHHGVRTATNGDVRLSPTPEQWDPIPGLIEKKISRETNSIEAHLSYPAYNFEYMIKAEAKEGGIVLSVNLEKPLPEELAGRAGFNMEFLPAAYFEKSYMMDNKTGMFPLYPAGSMEKSKWGTVEQKAMASGKILTLAPEDPEKRIIIKADNILSLYDGRNKAQNGWYVVQSLIPSGKTGQVIQWHITGNVIPNWIRTPMIAHSQVGYHPAQNKVAVIEFDKNDNPAGTARLLLIKENGEYDEKIKDNIKSWGDYLRYKYFTFDFTSVKESGIYIIEYNGIKTSPFRIAEDVYETAWHPTNDVYLNVQMDHMFVNEGYRVWHGASHLDDALQAPVDFEHFDLYAMGPTTDTKYKPGEHIPGLNIGGWFDAGDFDIRTQTHYAAVQMLVHVWEDFKPDRDQTTINQQTRFVDMHHPDGKPDILQQIEHGTLALIAQFRAVGHAIPGIVEAHLHQYTHLGDASTKTDNLIYNPKLDSLESDGFTSGTFDDRWAFTTKTTPLNYGSIAALAAASRVLKGFNDSLAQECFDTAVKVWDEEQSQEPVIFEYGNTTGGQLEAEELKAAVELLITTKEDKYAKRINELADAEDRFGFNISMLVRAVPFMDDSYKEKIEEKVKTLIVNRNKFAGDNPFGVPITRGGWAGSGAVVGSGVTNYLLHKTFPDLVDKENVFKNLNFIFGTHPYHNISLVSGVGTVSKKVAYGNNRADYSFIAGGVVPGILIIKPDFPENKEDWPFLWGENEYVIALSTSYIYLVNAVNTLLNE
ncbi:MAG: glycoside hydrolase family 9 protein [Ignavibacteriaceae bacterium]